MKTQNAFDPVTDIPDLAGHVYFITGGTSGLGKEAILALARHGARKIYFTGRGADNAAKVADEAKNIIPAVDVVYLQCDQTSLASVEAAVKKFQAAEQRLDVLICNAGIMGKDPELTKDGVELHFGINHLAHALVVKMLLPTLQKTFDTTGDARIVFIASNGFRFTPSGGIVFKDLKTTQDYWFAGRWVRYGQSKLANVVYPEELSRRYPAITSVSVHPGVIFTELWNTQLSLLNRVFTYLATLGQGISVHQGAYNQLWAATTVKSKLDNGAYYEPVGIKGALTKDSQKKELGEELWTWTQKELEGFGN